MAGKGRIENLKPWRKGQSGNPKGRPKKLVSSLLSELLKEGYAGTTKAEIEATCLILINLPVDRLAAIVKDEKAPLLFRATAKKLLSTDGYEAVLELIERGIGKAHQVSLISAQVKKSGSQNDSGAIIEIVQPAEAPEIIDVTPEPQNENQAQA